MGAGRVPLWGGALKCMFEGKSRRDDSRGRVVKQGCGVGGWGVGVATDTKSIRLNLSLFVRFISYSATHCYTDDNMIHFPKRDDKSYNNRRFFRTVPNGQHVS